MGNSLLSSLIHSLFGTISNVYPPSSASLNISSISSDNSPFASYIKGLSNWNTSAPVSKSSNIIIFPSTLGFRFSIFKLNKIEGLSIFSFNIIFSFTVFPINLYSKSIFS